MQVKKAARSRYAKGITVVDIGKVTVGNQTYYTDQVVESMEEYYSMKGESPGLYFGQLMRTLVPREKFEKWVDSADFQSLLAGRLPGSTQPLGSSTDSRTVLGFDLVCRAPKSVSLMFALGDPLVRKEVEAAHDLAVEKAMHFIEPHIGATRSGKDGVVKHEGRGIAGAAFKHRTSRELDPLLHTHNVVLNITQRESDGAFRALDSSKAYRWGKLAGHIYQAELRSQMTWRLGVEWGEVRNGLSDVVGVPKPVIKHFSKRQSEIKAELDERGSSSAKENQLAALRTRRAKQDAPENLEEMWRADAAELGFTSRVIDGLCGARTQLAVTNPDFAEVEAKLLGPDGLTANKAMFDFRDVAMRTFDLVDPATPPEVVTDFAEEFVARFAVAINVDVAEFFKGGSYGYRNTGEPVYTTPEMLAKELKLLEVAASSQGESSVLIPPHVIAKSSGDGAAKSLNEGQREMVHAILGSGNGVDIVVGDAGTGKTYALGVARQVFEQQRVRVIGTTISHSARLELENGSGIPSRTVSSLKNQIVRDGPESVFGTDGNCVLVVDEAGMVGTRDMSVLVQSAAATGAKVVLVGDNKQLQSIDAGGAFGVLERELGASRLRENMRQEDPIDREMVSLLEHDGAAAYKLARKHDRLNGFETVEESMDRLVSRWSASEHRADSIALAKRNADVDYLNSSCQSVRLRDGELRGEPLPLCGSTFYVGDRVVFRETNENVGFVNQNFGVVTRLTPETGQMFVRLDVNGAEIRVDAGTFASERGIRLGYAVTAHVSQGKTFDAVFPLMTSDLSKEYVTVMATRHRKEFAMFGTRRELETLAGFSPDESVDAIEEMSRPFTSEDRQKMAIDFLGIHTDDAVVQAKVDALGVELAESPPKYVLEAIGPPLAEGPAREKWIEAAIGIEINEQRKLDLKAGRVSDLDRDAGVKPLVLELKQRDVQRLRREQVLQLRGPRIR